MKNPTLKHTIPPCASSQIARAVRAVLAASSSAAIFVSGAALANPQGGTVVAGGVTINSPTANGLDE